MAAPTTLLKQTPLYDVHVALGARMTGFAGFDMPVQYSGIIDEHLAVRQAAGLFDVSHMGEVFVRGPQALAYVQHLVTNDAAKLYDGKAMYTVMCQSKLFRLAWSCMNRRPLRHPRPHMAAPTT